MNNFSFGTILLLVCALVFSCAKKKDEASETEALEDSVAYIVESAIGDANGQANSIVTASVGFVEMGQDEPLESESLDPAPFAACSISSARSSCSANTITINWNSCTIGTAVFTGQVTETFSGFGAASCQLNGDNARITRRVSDSNPRTLTFASGAKIVSDMSPDTAWDGTTFPSASTGTTVTRLESGTSNGQNCSGGSPCYNIVVNGLQNVLTGPKGRIWFDHVITSNLTAKGTKAGANLVVTGTSNVWHQVSRYKAVHTFNSVTWGNSSCCYPTSGTITSVLTGAISGSTTMSFTTTCGSASFTGTDNQTNTVTLTQCQP